MNDLKKLIEKYEKRVTDIKNDYTKDDLFISTTISPEGLEDIEKEYYVLIDVIDSLKKIYESYMKSYE